MLRASMAEMGLSARAHDKILRTAQTIADLDGSQEIRPNHLNEAINYRDAGPESMDVSGVMDNRSVE